MKRLLFILSLILMISLVLVSCSEKPQSGNTPSEDKTQEGYFPEAFNNRTFKLVRDTTARDASTEKIDYFYISTEDTSLYIDLHVNNYTDDDEVYKAAQFLSSSTEVTVTVSGTSCTAVAGDTTYTFTQESDGSVDIAINGSANSVINGSFTTSAAETADSWPIRFEKYEGVSQDSVAVRFLFTPVGVYYVMSSNKSYDNTEEWDWEGIKDYHLFLLKNIKVKEDGFVCRMLNYEKSVIRTLTFTSAGEGYTLSMTDDVSTEDFTFNLTKADFDPSFMFNPEIQMYDSIPEE